MESEQVVVSKDVIAPVAYMKFNKVQLEDKKVKDAFPSGITPYDYCPGVESEDGETTNREPTAGLYEATDSISSPTIVSRLPSGMIYIQGLSSPTLCGFHQVMQRLQGKQHVTKLIIGKKSKSKTITRQAS